MARISAAKKAENQKVLDNLIFDALIVNGDLSWSQLTYQWLSDKTGMRVSTLQGYYKDRASFANALKGRVAPLMAQHLDLSNIERLITSWRKALANDQFCRILSLWIHNLIDGDQKQHSIEGWMLFEQSIVNQLGERSRDVLMQLLGESLISNAKNNR